VDLPFELPFEHASDLAQRTRAMGLHTPRRRAEEYVLGVGRDNIQGCDSG